RFKLLEEKADEILVGLCLRLEAEVNRVALMQLAGKGERVERRRELSDDITLSTRTGAQRCISSFADKLLGPVAENRQQLRVAQCVFQRQVLPAAGCAHRPLPKLKFSIPP